MSIVHTKAWDEKYRPKTVQECILAQDIKDTFQGFVDSNFIPNLLLTGTSGVGKTTVARALCAELDYDIYEVNGSLNLGIDKLRTDIQQHAATMSFTNNRKAVFIDEADYLNAQSVQPALRGFIQDYHENCAFIMTANFPKKIIGPLAESRMTIVDFKIPSAERGKIAQAQFKRLCEILDLEGIEYDKATVVELVKLRSPDMRAMLNSLQLQSFKGSITTSFAPSISENFELLFHSMKKKDFKSVRHWMGINSDIESSVFYRVIYDTAAQFVSKDSLPELIIHLAKYQYQSAFVADEEINRTSFVVECMTDLTFT